MRIYFTIIAALLLVGTEVESRLREEENRELAKRGWKEGYVFPESCKNSGLCCCEDGENYCVENDGKLLCKSVNDLVNGDFFKDDKDDCPDECE
jgi:hypothetical protein